MRIEKIDRQFGVKLAAGVNCAPGIFINVDTSGTGVIATAAIWAHGVALVSGAGTKTAGISQYINLYRSVQIANIGGAAWTPGQVVYVGANGQPVNVAPGTNDQKVGFVLEGAADENVAFVDMHTQDIVSSS